MGDDKSVLYLCMSYHPHISAIKELLCLVFSIPCMYVDGDLIEKPLYIRRRLPK